MYLIIVLLILLPIAIIGGKIQSDQLKASRQEEKDKLIVEGNKTIQELKDEYDLLTRDIRVPENCQGVDVHRSIGQPRGCNIWVDNNQIYLVPNYKFIIDEIQKIPNTHYTPHYHTPDYYSNLSMEFWTERISHYAEPYRNPETIIIPIESISHFQITGESHTTTHISGGGGGGTSIKGAVIGGILAGDAGAIIGSRKEVKPIESYNVTINKRTVDLYYTENENISTIQFSSHAYKVLKKLIPEKEYSFVLAQQSKTPNIQNESIENRLSKLDRLKETNTITEQEYLSKRQEIIDSI